MKHYTKEQILRLVEEEDVEFIRLQFTDIHGFLKNIAVTAAQLYKALDNQYRIDGIPGEEEEELYLYPDLDTFTVLPWRPQQGKVARMLCDLYREDGSPYEKSPRYVLERAVKKAADMGYTCFVYPECEFFLFHTDDNGMPTTISHEKAGFLDTSPLDLGENARRDMVLMLEDMGFEIEASYHEKAPAQHEIDFACAECLDTADRIVTFKSAVRSIAKRHGLHATFMPKPRTGIAGSGLHLNFSLFKDGKNVFADREDINGLGKEAYGFIAGLLAHIKSITLLANPLVNSYKRLGSGFDAPQTVSWSFKDRNSLIRVPGFRDSNTRIELRSPDPSANPYLVLAACLCAGLEGIEKGMKPKAPFVPGKEQGDVDHLPGTLKDALDLALEDSFLKNALGDSLMNTFIEEKRREWEEYMTQVSDWEVERYLLKV